MNQRREQLEQLNKDALVEGYLLLEDRVRSLEKQVSDLRQLLGVKVPKTPGNSSKPSGQSQKANKGSQPRAKHGPKEGHRGQSRERSEADEIIECRVSACRNCGEDLTHLPQHLAGRHQVIDVPPIRPVVRELRRYGRYCPGCGTYCRAEVTEGFETGRVLGRNLEQWVVYLHYAHPLSQQRVQTILAEGFGIQLSAGALNNILQRAQAGLQAAAGAIHEQVKAAAVIGSDETSARLAGKTVWQWVFQTPTLAYHVIRPSRSAQVMQEVMGTSQPEVWVSDLLSSQLCHPAQAHQVCLAHQVRDLQYEIDSQDCSWAHALQALFYQAMALGKQRDSRSPLDYQQAVAQLEGELTRQLTLYPATEGSQGLWRRYRKHRQSLLLFLQRTDVPPTNNASEQALRNSVIYRKVTGGFRSAWGAELYANLLSVLETARRQGRSIFHTLAFLLAPQPSFSWIAE
jgi:transposase